MTQNSLRILVSGLFVVLAASSASAVIVSNDGGELFSDGFESVSLVSNTTFPDESGDYNPTKPGWSTLEDELEAVQVTNSTSAPDPGPFSGSKYLRLVREGGDNYSYLTIPDQTSGIVRVEWMVNVATNSLGGDHSFFLSNGVPNTLTGGGENLAAFRVENRQDVGVSVHNGAGWTDNSTVIWTQGQWQKWEVELNYAAGTARAGIDLASNPNNFVEVSWAPQTVNTVIFRAGFPAARSYIDAETFVAPTGDYNDDGGVDAADYVVWRKTDDGNQAGYDAWRTNFGSGGGGGAGQSLMTGTVPEPPSLVLASLLFSFANVRRNLWRKRN